ncbi:ATP-binding protein [Candidatus Zixiibacteriota bacterium]
MSRLFKVKYYWHNVDWGAQFIPDNPAEETNKELERMRGYDPLIGLALEAFRARFYPDEFVEPHDHLLGRCINSCLGKIQDLKDKNKETNPDEIKNVLLMNDPIHQAHWPWIGHGAALEFYLKLGSGSRNDWNGSSGRKIDTALLDELSGIIMKQTPDEMLNESLTHKLSEPWLLSWHWRAILPYVREWPLEQEKKAEEEKERLIIQQCQIRQWELLLCYWVKYPIGIDELTNPRSRKIHEKKRNLVRAPIFGVSNRITRWDVYRLFYSEGTRREIGDAVKKLVDKPLSQFSPTVISPPKQLSLAYVLGRHDCYYQIDKIDLIENGGNGLYFQGKLAFDIHPERDAIRGERGYYYTGGRDKAPITRPYELVDIPAFEEHDSTPVLLASDNYCRALNQLSEVLNDTTAKSILITAPPGSGKEVLSHIAYVCRNKIGNKPKGKMVTTSLAGMDVGDVQRILFGYNEDIREYCDDGGKLDKNYLPVPTHGLLFQAVRGALFLDEIDKTSNAVRSMLLRFLESEEVTIPNTNLVVSMRDDQAPMYIYAGSMSRREMFRKSPIDFWTRVSHVVEMSHPLDIGDESSAHQVVREYVGMFWRIHVLHFFKRSGHIKNLGSKPAAKRLYRPIVLPFFKELQLFLVSTATVEFVCDVLAEALTGRGQSFPSIRLIRSIVGHAVYGTVEMLLYSKIPLSAIETLKAKEANDSTSHRIWFGKLCDCIKKVHSMEAGDSLIKLYKLDFVVSFRQTLRRSATLIG